MNDQDRIKNLLQLARSAQGLAYTASTTFPFMREHQGAHAAAPDPRLARALPSDSTTPRATAMLQATSTVVVCRCGERFDLAGHEHLDCPDCGRTTYASEGQLEIVDDPIAREFVEYDKDVRAAERALERVTARLAKWQPYAATDPTETQQEMAAGELKETTSCRIHSQLGRPDVLVAADNRYKREHLCRSCGELRALIVRFPQASGQVDRVLREVVRQDAKKLTTAVMATAFTEVFGRPVLPGAVKLPIEHKPNESVRRKQQNLRAEGQQR